MASERRAKASGQTARSEGKAKPKPALEPQRAAKKGPGRGEAVAVKARRMAAICARFSSLNPNPKGELEHVNPFTLLVAVVLSAQSTDAGVNKATRGLFAAADTPEKMLALGEDAVREAIKTIGLYKTKAKNVIALSRLLIERHGGEVPNDAEALVALPGVGRKTANVVRNVVFGEATMAVDTHVFRLAHRLGLSAGTTPDAVEADLLRLVPANYGVPAHHWLILHGRYLCKARKPECWRCPIGDLCPYPAKEAAA